jgi:predicted DNA-binding transcriptional regulator YafY
MKRKAAVRETPTSRPPLERMMRIHASLQKGGFPNATRLAQDLEVATKTVHRDLEFMRDRMGLPIEFDASRNGYRYTEEVDAFPSLQISEGELFALMVAEKALQQYRGTPFEHRLVSALRKLERALPDTVSLNLADWDHTISFRTTAEPIVNVPVLERLADAIQRRQQLTLAYRKPGTRTAESRVVDPYHLANVNGDWYLFAFDHLRQAIRTFAPARIQTAEPTGKSFQRPARFALEKQLRDSFGVRSRDGDYLVVLHFDESVADYIREKRWHPSQTLEERPGGGVELRLRLGSLVEVQRWILGWAGQAKVQQPPELIAAVREAAAQLLTAHPAPPAPPAAP